MRMEIIIPQTGILVQKSYILYAHVPMLARAPAGWQLTLVDTPGFGEANMDNITSISKKLLTTSSAYLYIVDTGSIGDEMDATNMKHLFERDQGLLVYFELICTYVVRQQSSDTWFVLLLWSMKLV